MAEVAKWIDWLEAALGGEEVDHTRNLPPVVARSAETKTDDSADIGKYRVRKTVTDDEIDDASTDEALVPLVERVENWLDNVRSKFTPTKPKRIIRNNAISSNVADRVEKRLSAAEATSNREIESNVESWLVSARERVGSSKMSAETDQSAQVEPHSGNWTRPTIFRGIPDENEALAKDKFSLWGGLQTWLCTRAESEREDDSSPKFSPTISHWLKSSQGVNRRTITQDETYELSRQRNKSILSTVVKDTDNNTNAKNVSAPAPVQFRTLDNSADEDDLPRSHDGSGEDVEEPRRERISIVGADNEKSGEDRIRRQSALRKSPRISAVNTLPNGGVHLGADEDDIGFDRWSTSS